MGTTTTIDPRADQRRRGLPAARRPTCRDDHDSARRHHHRRRPSTAPPASRPAPCSANAGTTCRRASGELPRTGGSENASTVAGVLLIVLGAGLAIFERLPPAAAPPEPIGPSPRSGQRRTRDRPDGPSADLANVAATAPRSTSQPAGPGSDAVARASAPRRDSARRPVGDHPQVGTSGPTWVSPVDNPSRRRWRSGAEKARPPPARTERSRPTCWFLPAGCVVRALSWSKLGPDPRPGRRRRHHRSPEARGAAGRSTACRPPSRTIGTWARSPPAREVREALDWLLDNARPVADLDRTPTLPRRTRQD